MPFDQSFDDVYELGIRPAAENAGGYCERIDEQIFAESILARIYNQIAKADLIVADMTSRNPNVFYEVGYAHALGKTVILLTRDSADIPFDLKHYPHIVYGGSVATLRDSLTKRISYHLANPSHTNEPVVPKLEFVLAATLIQSEAQITVELSPNDFQPTIVIGVVNVSDTVTGGTDLHVGLVLPEDFPPPDTYALQLPDRRYLYEPWPIRPLFPGQWATFRVRLDFEAIRRNINSRVEAELRLFTPIGTESRRFYITFV
jgi:hypothetical protein